jgi:hypothetical protein
MSITEQLEKSGFNLVGFKIRDNGTTSWEICIPSTPAPVNMHLFGLLIRIAATLIALGYKCRPCRCKDGRGRKIHLDRIIID